MSDSVHDQLARIQSEIEATLSKISAVEADPKNLSPAGSFWKYVPSARAKTDKLAMHIANLTAQKRKLSGNPVPCNGYSGRQTNRR